MRTRQSSHCEVDYEESLAVGEGQEAPTRCKATSEDVLVEAAWRLEAASRAGDALGGVMAGKGPQEPLAQHSPKVKPL